jgi:ABC-type antimicrobial peptide transport system permease subunit
MFKNYILVAFRNIIRNKWFSLINIAGLAFGLTCFILISLWIVDELSFDRFHKNYNNIYRLVNQADMDGKLFRTSVNPGNFAPYLKEKVPEIEFATRYRPLKDKMLIESGENKFYENNIVASDPTFFDIFTHKFIDGNINTTDINSIIISQRMAEKYFGEESAVGKSLTFKDWNYSFEVSGVIENPPVNSHLKYDAIIPIKLFEPFDWGNHYFNTYFLLNPKADISDVIEKIQSAITEKDLGFDAKYSLQSLKDIHLKSNFDIDIKDQSSEINYNVYLFTFIAGFILLIACINFMNLSTAGSSKRSKEIGVRKVIGAGKKQLISQFLSEAVIISLLSLFVAFILIYLLVPYFNDLTGKTIEFMSLFEFNKFVSLLVITILTGLIAGSYPAFFLAKFNPVVIMKSSRMFTSTKSMIRNSLVVLQFALSIILIICSIVVFQQMNFITDKKLGFDKENLLYLGFRNSEVERSTIVNELKLVPNVENVTFSSDIPVNTIHLWDRMNWETKPEDKELMMNVFTVDQNFVKSLGLNIVAGRDYNEKLTTDKDNYIINQRAAEMMGLDDPVGKWFSLREEKGTIIGVVEDFNYKSLRTKIEPLIINIGDYNHYTIVKIGDKDKENTIKQIEAVWTKFNPEFPFEYNTIGDDLDRLYSEERKTKEIFYIMTFLGLFISCLGLFGLTMFMTQARVKEIGIRKVLGSSVNSIVFLLSMEFSKWVLLAGIIACPVGYILMNKWLANFAYSISINPLVLIISSVTALLIAFFTAAYYIYNAASQDPVKSLRYE